MSKKERVITGNSQKNEAKYDRLFGVGNISKQRYLQNNAKVSPIDRVKHYLNDLVPYVNMFKNIETLNLMKTKANDTPLSVILNNIAKIGGGQWYDGEPRELDIGLNASGNFVYLAEAYMFFHDKISQGEFYNLNEVQKNCAKIHDGWAIARLIDWGGNGTGFIDYQSTQLNKEKDPPEFSFINLSEIEVISLVNRGDDYPTITRDDKSIACNKFYIVLDFNGIHSRIRGDQLSMFVHFRYLTKKIQDQDQAFANYISSHKETIEPLVNYVEKQMSSKQQIRNQALPKPLQATGGRVQLGGRNAVVYEGPRGGKYIKQNGGFVPVKKALQGGKKTKITKKC